MPQLRGLVNIYDLDLFAVKQIGPSFLRTHTRTRRALCNAFSTIDATKRSIFAAGESLPSHVSFCLVFGFVEEESVIFGNNNRLYPCDRAPAGL